LFLIAFGHLAVELSSSFLPVVYPLLVTTLALNYAQIGAIALVASIGTSVAQPLFGYLGDRWNPRTMSALSVAWVGLLMGLVGRVNSYPLLLVVVGVGALGSAAFHPPSAMIASSSGKRRRGTAVSVFSVGGNLGSALSPVFVALGIERLGKGATILVTPVALLVSLLLYLQLGQRLSTAKRDTAERKGGNGIHPFAGIVLVVLTVMCLAWFQVTLKTYLPVWLQERGKSLTVGGNMLFVLLASSGAGSLLGGALSDRMGRCQLLILCLSLLGPATWVFLGASGWVQWAMVAVVGMLVGATFPASIVLAQETWPQQVGVASGLVMGLGWLPGGIGASVTGAIADRFSLDVGLRTLVVPVVVGILSILAYVVVQGRRLQLAPDRS
jgi:FSR family fosmidomycin resistance protein-like MFS transporter